MKILAKSAQDFGSSPRSSTGHATTGRNPCGRYEEDDKEERESRRDAISDADRGTAIVAHLACVGSLEMTMPRRQNQKVSDLFCDKVRFPRASVPKVTLLKMYKRNVLYKGLLICMVLFCAYMQWSPVVDLDYVWINGHEHYVGAASPHQTGTMVVSVVTQDVGAIFEDLAPEFQLLRLAQSATRLAPSTTLRL